ncbi:YhcB family protein [Celerinatantimonas sp. YJH-8]|uniref:YhcB family protein n=1 Tax=Celerinatantimonas sp. YJH-8 TaxID=3228714 RepID=UPI0038C44FD5
MSIINSLILIAIGLIFGVIIGRLLTRSRHPETSQLQTELQQSREELALYRQQVSEHFQNSAQLLESLALQYQKVYDHMAQQSELLMDNSIEKPELFKQHLQVVPPEVPQIEEDHDAGSTPPKDYSCSSSGLLNNQTSSS